MLLLILQRMGPWLIEESKAESFMTRKETHDSLIQIFSDLHGLWCHDVNWLGNPCALGAFPTWFFWLVKGLAALDWSDTSFQTKRMAHMRILQDFLPSKIVLSHSSNYLILWGLAILRPSKCYFLKLNPWVLHWNILKLCIFKAQAALALRKMMKHVCMPSLFGVLHTHKLLISLFLSTMNTFNWICKLEAHGKWQALYCICLLCHVIQCCLS